jgi:DNA repair exonuclease SbcCD ATPase subunit
MQKEAIDLINTIKEIATIEKDLQSLLPNLDRLGEIKEKIEQLEAARARIDSERDIQFRRDALAIINIDGRGSSRIENVSAYLRRFAFHVASAVLPLSADSTLYGNDQINAMIDQVETMTDLYD